jgi:hypothetical protein
MELTLLDRLKAENLLLAEIDFRRACEGDVNEELAIPAIDPEHTYHLAQIVEHTLVARHLRELEEEWRGNPGNPRVVSTLSALECAACDMAGVAERIRKAWGYRND